MTSNLNVGSHVAPKPEPEKPPEPEYTPEPRPKSYKEVTMEKVVTDGHPAHVGALFTWTYKSVQDWEAVGRAIKALKRAGEDPTHWKQLT